MQALCSYGNAPSYRHLLGEPQMPNLELQQEKWKCVCLDTDSKGQDKKQLLHMCTEMKVSNIIPIQRWSKKWMLLNDNRHQEKVGTSSAAQFII